MSLLVNGGPGGGFARNIHDRGYIVIKTNTGYKIINPNNPPNGP